MNNDNDYELNPEELKKLQRKEILEEDSDYDLDSDITEKPKAPPVEVEEIKITPPKEEKKIIEDFSNIDAKNTLPDDEIPSEEDIGSEPIYYDDNKYSTHLEDGSEKEDSNREYLNRRDTIYREPEELVISKPTNKNPKPIATKKKEERDYSTLVTGVAIAFFMLLIVFMFAVVWHLTSDTIELTETEKETIIEMSTFLSFNEEYVSGINELSEQKRILLESYLKGVRNKKELALELLAIKKKEVKILQLFDNDEWKFKEVVTSSNITHEFLSSNIDMTQSLVKMLGDNLEKGQILDYYNDTVKSHTAQLYTLQEYVKDEVEQFGVNTIVDDTYIQIDLTNVK